MSNVNLDTHRILKCLTVRQPYADLIVRESWRDSDGEPRAEKTIEVRSRKTNHRGDILICASKKPEVAGHRTGCTVGLVEIYGVKPVEEFTEEDWKSTCIPEAERSKYKGYGWLLRHPRRVIEMPIKGQLGLFSAVVPKDCLTEYPRVVKIGAEGWKLIQKKIKNDGESENQRPKV